MRDVLIIGSGAGGAPLALKLSQAGFDVLVLEKGPRYARSDYRHDEVHQYVAGGDFLPSIAEEPHVLVEHARANAAPKLTTLGWIACCVGGGTAHMGAALFRFHPDDFRLATRFGPYETVADWPYDYDDLEHYYCEAEWLIGVSGLAGGNPFEGFRSRRYPMPPLRSHPLARAFDETCRGLGLNPFPTPLARNSRPYGGRPECAYCDLCAGFGCPTGARGSTQEAIIPLAERTGRCEVRAEAMVTRITIDRRGRASGCVWVDRSGIEHQVESSIVCVCCSAVESARLLLLSAAGSFPDGLANGSGLVGRNLQFHSSSAGRARFATEPDAIGAPRRATLQRSVMDHYVLPAGVAPYPKGGLHCFYHAPKLPIREAQRIALSGPDRIVWGSRLKERLKGVFDGAEVIGLEVFHDFLPTQHTFMELDPEVKDKWGLPVARIHLAEHEHHRAAGRWLLDRGLAILDALGADELQPGDTGYTNRAMVHGTCRAGKDPNTSVLNEFCRSHEIPNLFVVDGGFMPTSGGTSSTLTILANSLRTADYIIVRARSREFG